MNERDLQLAKAMVDLEMDESVPKKTAVSKMQDKQQTFSYVRYELTVDCFEEGEPLRLQRKRRRRRRRNVLEGIRRPFDLKNAADYHTTDPTWFACLYLPVILDHFQDHNVIDATER